jgi:predicted N-acetyltransferase YhbS
MALDPPKVSHWSVRQYREGDIGSILALFAEAGFPARTEAQYRWRALTVPCAAATVWLAVDGDRVVGHNSGTPTLMSIEGQTVNVLHQNETATALAYRRQGILTAVCTESYRHWTAAGYQLVYGLPWGSYGSRRDALGWIPLFQLTWKRRWILPERALARRARLPEAALRVLTRARLWDRLAEVRLRRQISSVRVRELREPEVAFDRLWARAGKSYDYLVVRDRDWVAWRYFSAPDFGYRVLLAELRGEAAGYLVYRVERSTNGALRGWIADLFAPLHDTDSRGALVKAAIGAMRRMGVERVSALVAEGSAADGDLANLGFSGETAGDFFVIRLDPTLSIDGLQAPGRWHLMGGDFDLT